MRATINGLQVGYTDEGRGMPLPLVHGFPLNRTVWSKQVEAFRTGYRVIAPDLRGLGESEATTGPVSMFRFAEDLHALVPTLDAGPVVRAGHSMGGYAALAFAKAFPRELRGLVLLGTRAGPDAPGTAAERRAMAKSVRALGASAQLNIIRRAGHLVAFEQAEAFNEALWNGLAWGARPGGFTTDPAPPRSRDL